MGKGQELYNRAKEIMPGGTQLLSKRPEMWLPDLWPSYYSKAKGCEIWDMDGNHYYDMGLMGIGSSVLGYAFDEVDEAAKEAVDNGSMCTLNAPEEVELAEKLLELHPWADMVRYAKAGGEAMAMAVRIVRAFTGKDVVLVCGYHGWHDWYLSANLVKGDPLAAVHLKGLEPAGVPQGLAGTNCIFHYNDIEGFKQLVDENKGNIAAVVMEPVRNDMPLDGFLEEIRKITEEEGIVLVFDEITAGFRFCPGGSHLSLRVGVIPDIAVFAKAMTNGYPVSAVIGKRDVMQAAQDTFISSLYWTERVAYAATIKAIECYEKYKVHEHQMKIGKMVQQGWTIIAERTGVNITVSGIYPLSHFDFNYENRLAYKTFFTQELLKKGYIAATGLYVSLAHKEEMVKEYLDVCEGVFKHISEINELRKPIESCLDGSVCHAGFERLN